MAKKQFYHISFSIDDKDFDEWSVLLEHLLSKIHKEPGNIAFYSLKNKHDANAYEFIGIWESEEATQIHLNSDYFQEYVPQVGRFYKNFKVTELEEFL